MTLLETDAHSSCSRIVAHSSHCIRAHGDYVHSIFPNVRPFSEPIRLRLAQQLRFRVIPSQKVLGTLELSKGTGQETREALVAADRLTLVDG